ncbi:MAG: diguanylate cyclase [Mycolicibacterium sp.]|uniref:diguanylate cyclase domain-containing protein n=1 Tax=Mycolicibacterium sp. TaxID=2320850 RepID=UPI003D11EAC0
MVDRVADHAPARRNSLLPRQKGSVSAPGADHDDSWGRAVFWPRGARWRGGIWFTAIFCAYAGVAWLYPFIEADGVALLWVPNAVLVTALLRFRPRDWPYVYAVGLLAEVVADRTYGVAPHQALYFGFVNAIEATLFVFCAALIAGGRRHIGLLTVRGALSIVLAAVLTPALTGALGAVGSVWTFDSDYFTAWRTWWFGDGLGLLVGVPIGLLLRDASRSVARRRSGPLALSGGGAAVLLLVPTSILATAGNAWGAQQTVLAAGALLALTFGAVGAPVGAVLTATLTLLGLARGEGLTSVASEQALLFVVFATGYAVAGATEAADQAMVQLLRARSDLEDTHRGLIALHAELEVVEQAEARLAAVVQSSDDAIFSMTPDGVIQTWNPAAGRLLGHPEARMVGQPVESLMPAHSQELCLKALDEIRRSGRAERHDTQWVRADHTLVDVAVNVFALRDTRGDLTGFSAIARDITQRIQAQRQLERLARFDALTGLTNRGETISRLESALADARSPGAELGVLFCDVDRFKAVNDTWGHNAGDVVLSTLADRIRGCVRHGDTVGRTGGDEILVLLPGLHSLDEAAHVAEKIRRSAAEPVRHCASTFNVTLSIGVTLAVQGEPASATTARADEAMYQAKRAGGNNVTCI